MVQDILYGSLVEILCYFEVYLKTDTCVTVIFKGIKIERKDCEDISRGIIFGPATNNQKGNPPNHLQVVPLLSIRNDGVSYFAFIGNRNDLYNRELIILIIEVISSSF